MMMYYFLSDIFCTISIEYPLIILTTCYQVIKLILTAYIPYIFLILFQT